MATNCIAQLTFRYQGLRAPVVARFDVPHASSDGGLVLLKPSAESSDLQVWRRLRAEGTCASQVRWRRVPSGTPRRTSVPLILRGTVRARVA